MNLLKKQLKLVVFFLVAIITLQSCRVYHRDTVTIDHAIASQKRVKIKTIHNRTLKFKQLIFEDGIYYGIKPVAFKYDIKKIRLDKDAVQSVRLHNKGLSIFYGITETLMSLVVVGVAIALASFDLNLDFSRMSAPL